MKSFTTVFTILLCIVYTTYSQNNVGINDDNSAPKASAMLDVYSSTKGLLIPRIALTSTTIAAPVTSPEASLLVYNTATAGDVIPGYYYWNGSNWIRLQSTGTGIQKLSSVIKTSNGTIAKTDNMVFASGDITLTLPVVTSADNGLEISVKNIGTYMDVITITGATGSELIDATTSSTLYKDWGISYIAKDGNWLTKENVGSPDNLFDVSSKASWTTIAEIVEFLGSHMTGPSVIRIGAGTYPIDATQTIDLPYPVTFEGLSFGETTIEASSGVSGTPLFSCATECYFKKIIFNAISNTSGNDAIHFTGSGTYHEVKDCYFVGFNKGIVSMNNNDLWIFENDFEDCAGAGIEIAAGIASGGSLKISECDFMSCAKGINLLSGVSENFNIMNCTFYNTISGSDIGILYTPATFTSFTSIIIINNAWNNEGIYISGFDFTRSDGRDADAVLSGNIGMADQKPHCKINVDNNLTTTTVTTAGTYYKANWTNAATSYACKWTLADNKITFQPENSMDVWSIITGNISVNNQDRVITIGIVKNGVSTTRYGETSLRITTANQPFQFSTVIHMEEIVKDDYLELWVTSSNSSDIVIFQDIQWFTNAE